MKARFIFILIAFLSASCTQIYFKQPQPKGKKEIPEFPVTIRGVYSVESMDTVIVFAGGYNWIEVSLMRVALTQFNTESDVRIDNDRLFDENHPKNGGYKYTIKNDTVFYSVSEENATYLSDSLKLKKTGNYYVLNQLEKKNNNWLVMLIELETNGDLQLYTSSGNFSVEGDKNDPKIKIDGKMEDFFRITNFEKIDDSDYLADPTKKEFKKLIKAGMFPKLEKLVKVKN